MGLELRPWDQESRVLPTELAKRTPEEAFRNLRLGRLVGSYG